MKRFVVSVLTTRIMIANLFLLVTCAISLSYGLEIKDDEIYVDFKEHPESASAIIKEVKGLKINNIYGSKSGVSYSLTNLKVNTFNADKIRIKQNSATDYQAQLQNGLAYISGNVRVSKKIKFWRWSKTISASATANVYLKRVYVTQNVKLQFIGQTIKAQPGTCATRIYYHKIDFKAGKGFFSKIITAIAKIASKLFSGKIRDFFQNKLCSTIGKELSKLVVDADILKALGV